LLLFHFLELVPQFHVAFYLPFCFLLVKFEFFLLLLCYLSHILQNLQDLFPFQVAKRLLLLLLSRYFLEFMKAFRDVIVSHIETLLIFSERIFEGFTFQSRPSNPFGLLKGLVLLVNY